jgi:putative transposase
MSRNTKEQYWKNIFQQHAKSGLTKAEFCKNNNVTISTYYAWAKKLSTHASPKKQKVVPLVFPEIKPEQQLTLTLPNGYQFSFPDSLEPSKLQQFLHVLSA